MKRSSQWHININDVDIYNSFNLTPYYYIYILCICGIHTFPLKQFCYFNINFDTKYNIIKQGKWQKIMSITPILTEVASF